MKRKQRWIIALLLVGGFTSTIALTSLWRQLYYGTSIIFTSIPTTSAPAPDSPPVIGVPGQPDEISASPPDLESNQLAAAEAAIDRALSKLPKGEVYHNVPETMKVNRAEVIEAGIAPTVTEQIQQELQGSGEVQIESGVRFDPRGVEMKLLALPKNEFEVSDVWVGKQFVTGTTPGKWAWQVTPLAPGDHLIVIKAIVDLRVPELDVTHPIEVEVFRATRSVQVNPVYSVRTFAAQNWKELLGLVIGTGSVARAVTWWMGRKPKAV